MTGLLRWNCLMLFYGERMLPVNGLLVANMWNILKTKTVQIILLGIMLCFDMPVESGNRYACSNGSPVASLGTIRMGISNEKGMYEKLYAGTHSILETAQKTWSNNQFLNN